MLLRVIILWQCLLMSFITGTAATWRPWPGNEQLPTREVYSIFVKEDGRVYVGTDEGLYLADAAGTALRHVPLFNRYGKDKGSVRYIDNRTVITLEDVFQLKRNRWQRIGEASDNYLYKGKFIERGGVEWIYDRRNPYIMRVVSGDTLDFPKALSGKIITDMVSVGNSRIAIATNNDGIYIFNLRNGKLKNLRHTTDGKGTLPRNHIMGVAFDASKQLLYAAIPQSGVWISKLDAERSELLKTGVEEDISSVIRDSNGFLWLSYDGRGIQILDRQMRQTKHIVQATSGIPTDIITALFPIAPDIMLASTYGKGVFKINRFGQWERIPELNENSDAAQCRSIVKDKNGNLWVGTFTKGVVIRTKDGNTKTFNSKNSALRTDYITDVEISPSGDSVFVATGFGLFAFDVNRFSSTAFNPADGRPLKIRQMAYLSDGSLLLGTDIGVFDRHGHLIALERVAIKAITAGRNNDAWCVSDSAIYYIGANRQVRIIKIPSDTKFGNYALSQDPSGDIYAGCFGALLITDADAEEAIPLKSTSPIIWIIIVSGSVLAFVILLASIFVRKNRDLPKKLDATPEVDMNETALLDKKWLETVSSIVDANLSDANFGVEELGRAMGMSRSNLYKKITALSGKTPQEYLRKKRLDAGRRLLDLNRDSKIRLTLSEVAYKVGMSPRQFSKYLRENDK